MEIQKIRVELGLNDHDICSYLECEPDRLSRLEQDLLLPNRYEKGVFSFLVGFINSYKKKPDTIGNILSSYGRNWIYPAEFLTRKDVMELIKKICKKINWYESGGGTNSFTILAPHMDELIALIEV